MTPTHHPSEALLIAYAAGSTRESEALALSTHLTFCAPCRERLRTAEAMGGYLLEQMEAAPVADSTLEDVLARLDDEPTESAAMPAPMATPPIAGLPVALATYADEALRATGWRWVAPGIRQLQLTTGTGVKARLMRFAPGTVLPVHGHGGQELTVVLHGSYSDKLGQFGRGDLAENDDNGDHEPRADSDEDCIALIVTDSKLRFRGWIARLAQLWTGI